MISRRAFVVLSAVLSAVAWRLVLRACRPPPSCPACFWTSRPTAGRWAGS